MKKSITGVVVMVLLTLSAFANTDKNKEGIKQQRLEDSFKKEFSNAQGASWTKFSNYYRVQFTLDSQIMFAVMDTEGKMIGLYRNILSSQLPIQLANDLKSDYSGYWISELFELVQDNQTYYYVTLENASEKVTLKSDNSSNWFHYQQAKK